MPAAGRSGQAALRTAQGQAGLRTEPPPGPEVSAAPAAFNQTPFALKYTSRAGPDGPIGLSKTVIS
eukprot:750918-Hanusia_phi.AAC.1